MSHAGGFPLHNTAAERERVRLEGEVHRLRIENRTLRNYLSAVESVLGAIGSTPDESGIIELLGRLLGTALDGVDARNGSLLVVDDDHGDLVFIVVRGSVPEDVLEWRRLPAGRGVAGWVATHREPVIVNDPGSDPKFSTLIDEEIGFETRSLLAVPIERDGRLLGVMEAINKNADRNFTGDDAGLVVLAARLAAELLELMERMAKPPPRRGAGATKRAAKKRKPKKRLARRKAGPRKTRARGAEATVRDDGDEVSRTADTAPDGEA